MGNLMPADGCSVHGVLYRLSNIDFARLTNMEHEYRYTIPHCCHRLRAACVPPSLAEALLLKT
jgi:hypothetical protein